MRRHRQRDLADLLTQHEGGIAVATIAVDAVRARLMTVAQLREALSPLARRYGAHDSADLAAPLIGTGE